MHAKRLTAGRMVSVALAAAALLLGPGMPAMSRAQDSSGRPTTPQDNTGRPKIRKTGKPKKVIRGRASTDVEKVPSSSVIIRSYPPGAEVYVDGVAVGTTADDGELELSDVRLGAHKIVLKKDGYREWSQVVTLRSTTDKEEIEPLLQSESAQYLRDKSKMEPLAFGKPITGQISRDGLVAREGGFYNEYMLHVASPDAFVIALTSKGTPPKLRIVDESNSPFAVQVAGTDVYHTAYIPTPGDYYLQVIGPVDESSFTGADYSLVVLPESQAHADRSIAVGDTADGMLEPTDRLAGPGDYFDGWKFEAQAGLVVHIAAKTNGGFRPALTLLLDGKVVASSGSTSSKSKKKKGAELAPDAAEINATLTGGTYILYVRSDSGPKFGAYQLSITMGG